MINKKMIPALALTSSSMLILLKLSIPIIFITVLLGLLFIPPVLTFAWVLAAGAPVIVKELGALFESGKEIFVISISKESIVLEPNLNR